MSSCSILLLCVCITISTGCTTTAPRSFTQTRSPSWSAIELRESLSYDKAWGIVFDILVRTFGIDLAIKEDGYIRTGWLHTWSGKYTTNYRVRVTVKFSQDKSKLQIRSDANFLSGNNWVAGTDTRLVSTLKTDVMGTVGRTTR
jgi:hypothetical protein